MLGDTRTEAVDMTKGEADYGPWQELRGELEGTWATSAASGLKRLKGFLADDKSMRAMKCVQNYLAALRSVYQKHPEVKTYLDEITAKIHTQEKTEKETQKGAFFDDNILVRDDSGWNKTIGDRS